MREITIDCSGIREREQLHDAFAQALSFPKHYGKNLDALHDCLTSLCEETRLELKHWDAVEAALGRYAIGTRRALIHSVSGNPLLTVIFD